LDYARWEKRLPVPPRPGLEPPPDQLANPTLVVAVGGFGDSVARALERRAAEVAEVFGAEATRNLATWRILRPDELRHAQRHGLDPEGPLRRGLWLQGPDDLLDQAFSAAQATGPADSDEARPPGSRRVQVGVGYDPGGAPADETADELLERGLVELVAHLFRVDSFVDFQQDQDRLVSRLDVFVVAESEHPLAAAVNCAIRRRMAALARGRLLPLFRAHHSNLVLAHLVALPIVREPHVQDRVRRLVARHRAELSDDPNASAVPSRFLFLEDRSHKYVVSREQMVSAFVGFLDLLLFERPHQREALRAILQSLPAADRFRRRAYGLNNLCGSFSVAALRVPVARLVRYCRNRQVIALLNEFLGRPQDGAAREVERGEPIGFRDEVEREYGTDGQIERTFQEIETRRRQELDRCRRELFRERPDVCRWGLADPGEWQHHGDLVPTFHNDLDLPRTPLYSPQWLGSKERAIRSFCSFFVYRVLRDVFREVEREGHDIVHQRLMTEREAVDALVLSGPSGWKKALRRLEVVVQRVDERRREFAERILRTRYTVDSRTFLQRARSAYASLVEHVDRKPLGRRLAGRAKLWGGVAGLLAGVVASLAFPWHLGGVALAVPFTSAAGVWGGRWLARRYNRRIHEAIREIVSASDDCRMAAALVHAREVLTDILEVHGPSWVGERVSWSFTLWRLRMWSALHTELSQDLERLRDIGRVLDIQVERFRADQESIGVRFSDDDGVIHEDPRYVLDEQDIFVRPLIAAQRFDDLYARHMERPEPFANRYMAEREPFAAWRVRLPFSDDRELASYGSAPFLPLVDYDYFSGAETSADADQRARAFLGDFFNKMEVQVERTASGDEGVEDEHKLLVAHSDVRAAVLPIFRALSWPEDWLPATDAPGRHGLHLLRYVEGLAPWHVRVLGDESVLVRTIVAEGRADTLPELVGSVSSDNVRAGMIATYLAEVFRIESERPPSEGFGPGCDTVARTLLAGYEPRRRGDERLLDGARVVSVAAAAGWAARLAGAPGLLGLVSRLYAVRDDPDSPRPIAAAEARADLVLLAAQGQADWAYRELARLPDEHVCPVVRALLHAEAVQHLLARRMTQDARLVQERIEDEQVAASSLLRAAVALAARGDRPGAHLFLDLAAVPDDGRHGRLSPERHAPLADVSAALEALRPHPNLLIAVAGVYAGPECRPPAAVAPQADPRIEVLLNAAAPGAGPADVLRQLEKFPRGFVDPNLLTALRSRS